MPDAQPLNTPRLHSLDAVRAGAMLIGVLLHSAAPYMQVPLRGLIMPIQQYAGTHLPDTLFWIVHATRLPVFFVVAGFLARESLSRHAPFEFLRHRWKRLGIPLLIAFPIVTLIMHPIWRWGWIVRGWANPDYYFNLKYGPELQRAIWGLNHFWFLEYLLLYCLLIAAIVTLWKRITLKRTADATITRVRTADINLGEQSTPLPKPTKREPRAWRLIPLSLLIIATSAVLFSRDASWFLDFHNAYIPHAATFVYYLCFFALGLSFRRSWLTAVAKASPILIALAAIAIVPTLRIIASSVWQTDHGPRQGRLTDSVSDRVTLGLLVSSIGVASSLGIIGLSTILVRRATKLGAFLIDAAYWVFITHLIWIGLAVMLLRNVPIAPELKMTIVALFSGGVSLATYIPLRKTKVGRWLGSTAPAPGYTP